MPLDKAKKYKQCKKMVFKLHCKCMMYNKQTTKVGYIVAEHAWFS